MIDADDDIDAKEVDVFLRMLEKPRWCKSEIGKQAFPEARAAYSEMWKAYQSGSLDRNANQLRGLLQQIAPSLGESERSALTEDLTRLGYSVARASGGFLGIGAPSREELGSLASLDEIYRETLGNPEAIQTLPPEQITTMQKGPEVWTKGKRTVRVVGIIDETHDVKTYQLVGEPACQFSYRPGQACVLEVPIDGKPVFRYMKAIPTAELCVVCHGSDIDPYVDARIRELYPDDQARGFKPGDIRGAFTLSKPL